MIHHVKKAAKKTAEIAALKKVYIPALGIALAGGAAYFSGEITDKEAIGSILKGLLILIGGG